MSHPRLRDDVLRAIGERVAWGGAGPLRLRLELYASIPPEEALEGCDPAATPHELAAAFDDALSAAVRDAFARKARDAQAWPEVTECDRLCAAFAALDAGGIVAVERLGFTLREGLDLLAFEALVRDELGRGPARGYCFFHAQDAERAAAAGGLALAFGSLVEDGPAATRAVGAEVVRALERAGLEPRWGGAANTRVDLPAFRVRRRGARLSPEVTRAFTDAWELELRSGYADLANIEGLLTERACERLGGYEDFDAAAFHALHTHTERVLRDEHARELTWREFTVNDRVRAALGSLRAGGLFAEECLGSTLHDGWTYAAMKAPAGARSAVFFHREDVFDAVEGRGLWVAFGALFAAEGEHEARSLEAGRALVRALEAHGVACSWSGLARDRVHVAPFEWRRRRWTEPAPPERYEPVAASTRAASAVTSPSLARGFATRVRAERDENGFHPERSRAARAAWSSVDATQPGQLASLGLPFVNTPAGAPCALVPRAAAANLSYGELAPLFVRARAAR